MTDSLVTSQYLTCSVMTFLPIDVIVSLSIITGKYTTEIIPDTFRYVCYTHTIRQSVCFSVQEISIFNHSFSYKLELFDRSEKLQLFWFIFCLYFQQRSQRFMSALIMKYFCFQLLLLLLFRLLLRIPYVLQLHWVYGFLDACWLRFKSVTI